MSATQPSAAITALLRALGPTTLLTGALYYFGWVRTRALSTYFGIDPDALNYSVADFVLRSVDSVFGILVFVAVAALVVRTVFRAVLRVVARLDVARNSAPRRLGRFVISRSDTSCFAAALVGLGGLGLVVLVLVLGDLDSAGGRGVTVLLYVGLLSIAMVWAGHHLASARGVSDAGDIEGAAQPSPMVAVPLALLVAATFFAIVFVQANRVGYSIAVNRAAQLSQEPEVVLLSQHELNLVGHGDATVVSAHGEIAEPWTYRYEDLRLFAETNGRWFLLPGNWQESPRTFIVPISDTVRLDIAVTEDR